MKRKTTPTIKDWKDKNGDTYTIIAIGLVKKGETQEDVKEAFSDVADIVPKKENKTGSKDVLEKATTQRPLGLIAR